jgi:hypothetical protein
MFTRLIFICILGGAQEPLSMIFIILVMYRICTARKIIMALFYL